MSQSRTRRGGTEFDQLARLKYENKKLKRQIKQLRKVIDRLDLDRYNNVKRILEQNERLEKEEARRLLKEQLEKKWKCWDCNDGVLHRKEVLRRDGAFYYRLCDNCKKRTKLQKSNGEE